MSPFTLSDDLALARGAVAAADLMSLSRFRAQDLVVNTKPDRTPVTDADTAVEDVLRASLHSARPGDAILGEERGTTSDSPRPQPGRQWIIDPVDGTANFLRGVPIWATLIALAIDGDSVVSVVSAPALGQQWWVVAGHGAWPTRSGEAAPRKLEVGKVAQLEDARVNYSSLPGWIDDAREAQVRALAMSAWRARYR